MATLSGHSLRGDARELCARAKLFGVDAAALVEAALADVMGANMVALDLSTRRRVLERLRELIAERRRAA